MRFIRKHGQIIPIRDSTEIQHSAKDRLALAGSATAHAAGGSTAIYGLAKKANKFSESGSRLKKLAEKSAKGAEKKAGQLVKEMAKGQIGKIGKDRIIHRIAHSAGKSEKLAKLSNAHNLKSIALKRGAFVIGGLALGHAISKGIEAITGKENSETKTIAAHAAGISTAAIAASAIKTAKKSSKLHYAKKVLKMAGKAVI